MSTDRTDHPDQPAHASTSQADDRQGAFPELEELQREIARRLKDNQRFLEHFLDEDFQDETAEEETGNDPDEFEEL